MSNSLLSDTKFFLDHMDIIKSQRDILEKLIYSCITIKLCSSTSTYSICFYT
ncbi:hypothetical protein Q5M85_16705 [Paraclostridium bifermentans]|nr:hypothetical protein [Paraclostridium bifermentans]